MEFAYEIGEFNFQIDLMLTVYMLWQQKSLT